MDITITEDGEDVDYRALLVKYIAHVGAAEGFEFAFNLNMSPCGMGDLGFTEGDIEDLRDAFDDVRDAWASLSE